jgi:hypothetical protein
LRRAPWALAVCATLLGPPTPVWAWAPAKDGLLREADAHRKQGEHRPAAEKYAAYWRAQDEAQRASSTGAYIVDFAVASYLAAFDASVDVADLEAARDLLREFIGDVERVHGSSDQVFAADAKVELQRVETQIEQHRPTPAVEPEPEPQPDAKAEPAPAPLEPEPAPPPAIVDRPPPRQGPDKLGIGLVVGGSVIVLGGVGMLIAGSQYVSIARDRLREAQADAEGDDQQPDGPAYLDHARDARNLMLGLGAAVVVIGLVPTIWGAVRLARRSKATARLSIGPRGLVF